MRDYQEGIQRGMAWLDEKRQYTVTVSIEETAANPREAAEQAREDLIAQIRRAHLFTVSEDGTEVEAEIDLNDPVSGLELEFDRQVMKEGR